MSYTRGMGDTAADIARIAAAAAGAASSIITAAATPGTTPAATTVDPATGLPYGTINPATGLPYGTAVTPPATDYTVPLVIGGLALVGVGGYFLMRKRSTPNRRRVRRNSRRGERYTATKYGRRWAVLMEPSMTWLFTKGGKRGAEKRARELNASASKGR